MDDEVLLGPPDRIKDRWKPWLDSGVTGVILQASDEAIELMSRLARD